MDEKCKFCNLYSIFSIGMYTFHQRVSPILALESSCLTKPYWADLTFELEGCLDDHRSDPADPQDGGRAKHGVHDEVHSVELLAHGMPKERRLNGECFEKVRLRSCLKSPRMTLEVSSLPLKDSLAVTMTIPNTKGKERAIKVATVLLPLVPSPSKLWYPRIATAAATRRVSAKVRYYRQRPWS